MSEIPPDKSIVAIQSCLYGTYLTACPDQKSVTLHKVNDPNKLPKNCLWTLRSEPIFGYSIGSLKFISCYGRQLAVKGYFWKEVCQENYVTGYTRFGSANWTYDQFGTNDPNDGYRLMTSLSGVYMCAKENGQLSIDFNPFYLCTEPEAYWKIHHVLNSDGDEVVPLPARPQDMQSCNDAVRKDDEDQRERRGVMINVYNNPMAINSGGNVNNGRREQHNGGVKAANNTKKLYR